MSQAKTLQRSVPSKLRLEVVGGLHSGVHLPLDDGDYTIGSKAGADILLRDAGVASQHLIICISGNDVRAEAIGGGINVGDNILEAGHGYRLRLPAEIVVGEASLRLSREHGDDSVSERLPIISKLTKHPAIAIAGIMGCTLAIAVPLWSSIRQEQNVPGKAQSSSAVNASAASLANAAGNAVDAKPEDAARELQNKLQNAQLQSIKISIDGSRIIASGHLPGSRASEWTSIQRWFDQTYSPKLLMTSNVSNEPLNVKTAFRVQAIWYGDRPYVIAENGTRYYEGAVLDSGWILQKIGEDRIMLSKNEETLTLTYK